MATSLSQDAVDNFMAITDLGRNNAVEWLRANNNDVERAVNAYMDNPMPWPPRPSPVKYNESDFHSDQTANGQQAFNVHPHDTLTPGVFSAPSRPPSRVSNRGPGEGNAQAHSQFSETEQQQMDRAMAMSLDESQTLQGQETGVTEPTFGPAMRESYDLSQWAMTVPGAPGVQTTEIVLDPVPADRKREVGFPAFLKPTTTNHRLASLLKILHEIPLSRKALLNETYQIPDYGHDKEWWSGTPIKVLKVINIDGPLQDTQGPDILHETQRLMAFLDETQRSYAGVEILADLLGATSPDDRISKFLAIWYDLTSQLALDKPIPSIFKSKGIKKDLTDGTIMREQEFSALTVTVDHNLANTGMNLYDALDDMMWADWQEHEIYLSEVGDILTLEVTNNSNNAAGLGIEVPATWYLDRYLESSTAKVREMLDEKGTIHKQMQEVDDLELNVLKLQRPTKAGIDASTLVSQTQAYFEGTISYRDSIKGDAEANGTNKGLTSILDDLKLLSDRIADKLRVFEKTRESARNQMREISMFLTKPTEDPATSPSHQYTLRGVATTPQLLYVLEGARSDTDEDLLSFEAQDWQWWRIEYISHDAKPVKITKTSEAAVLEAAHSESSNALLVYASEAAILPQHLALSQQLRNFVRADNLGFSAELERDMQSSELSPGKRKATDSDSDDMITQHSRTPPNGRDLLDDDEDDDDFTELDASLPDYGGVTAKRGLRPLRPRVDPPQSGTTDDKIPLSLQGTGAADFEIDDSPGQEMEERRGRPEISTGYTLGSYQPEIKMDEDEEEEISANGATGQKEKVWQPPPRGARDEEMW